MRGLPTVLATLVLGLALGASAFAQGDKDKNKNNNRGAVETEKVHGIIAGVTVEGEMAVDYRTRKAVEADMTFLTIVGTPRHDAKDKGDKNDKSDKGDKADASGRHRHNVYVLWLSPRSKVCDASRNKDAKEAAPSTVDALEVGDRIEVRFTRREIGNTAGNTGDQARAQKHGRHRVIFGDATEVTILGEPRSQDASSDANRSSDKNKK